MSFSQYKDDATCGSGSFNKRRGSSPAECDFDTVSIPGAILDRQLTSRLHERRPVDTPIDGPYYDSILRNLVGSTISDTVYLIKYEPSLSHRKWLVGPYCFLYMAAYITSYFTFTQYVYSKIQSDVFPDVTSFNVSGICYTNRSSSEYIEQTHVQQRAATWQMYYSLAAGIPAVFSNIILGSSTDKFGRKFLFFLPCMGTFIRICISVLGIYLNLDLKYHLIGYVIDGITGQLATMLLVCFTYVADITASNGKQRSFGITMIELSIGIGLAIFSFTTGYFIQRFGFFYPMMSAGLMVSASVVIVFFIPESFPKEKRNPHESIAAKMKTIYDLFLGSFNRGRRWMYNTLMLIFLLTMFTVFGRTNVEPLYQLDAPFCWSPEKLGYFGALKSLVQQIFGMGMIKVLQMVMSDEAIGMLGCASLAMSFTLEGFATSDVIMYIVPVVGACGMLTIPITRSIMSQLTRSDQQGAVFAAIAAMETTINVGGSVTANEIYSHTIGFYKGFVFFVFTGCNVTGLLLMSLYRFWTRRSQPQIK